MKLLGHRSCLDFIVYMNIMLFCLHKVLKNIHIKSKNKSTSNCHVYICIHLYLFIKTVQRNKQFDEFGGHL